MNQQSFRFPSSLQLCQFLREAKLRRFLLLGKQCVLIAIFPAGYDILAQQKYGAVTADIPKEAELMAIPDTQVECKALGTGAYAMG